MEHKNESNGFVVFQNDLEYMMKCIRSLCFLQFGLGIVFECEITILRNRLRFSGNREPNCIKENVQMYTIETLMS